MLNEGVKVALGSDIAGGDHLHMFDVVAASIRASKARRVLDNWETDFLTVPEGWYLATSAGAAYFAEQPGFAPGTVILRGHTHIPRGESLDGLHFWNPGSLSLPKGGFPRSYGLYEDGCFHVYDMEGKELLRHWPRQNWPHQEGR
jgi:hypothetical protein